MHGCLGIRLGILIYYLSAGFGSVSRWFLFWRLSWLSVGFWRGLKDMHRYDMLVVQRDYEYRPRCHSLLVFIHDSNTSFSTIYSSTYKGYLQHTDI